MTARVAPGDIVRARAALVDVVGASVALHKEGGEYVGLCPFHHERTPSFKVNAVKGFGHCFGCGWHGDAIAFAQETRGLTFFEAVSNVLDGDHGVAVTCRRSSTPPSRPERDNAKRRLVREMWASASVAGVIAGTYLPARAITIPIPPTIREHAALKHTPTGLFLSALVCAVQGPDGRVCGIQRIYLSADYRRQASVQKRKMALGPKRGGSVRLGPAGAELGICEGVETGLSAMQLYGGSVWAALGNTNMPNLIPPDVVERVVIYGDNGDAGHRLAEKAASVFHHQGRKVTLVFPTGEYGDFNDVLRAQQKELAA